jgi:hypothetical protein
MKSLDNKVKELCFDANFREEILSFLEDICKVDTTPNADVSVMRKSEAEVFDILKKHLNELELPNAKLEEKMINPAIDQNPDFHCYILQKQMNALKGCLQQKRMMVVTTYCIHLMRLKIVME